MLTPTLCACGCLLPMFEGDEWRDGLLFNHGPAHRSLNVSSYLVLDMRYKTPCWVWQGSLTNWGYAKIKRGGKTYTGHRLFYRAYVDPNLPASVSGGDGLDHLCRIHKCVNPEHVEPVTCLVNIRRGLQTKLSEAEVREILRIPKGEMSQSEIAKKFGIAQAHVSRIVNGRRWEGVVAQ